jgi:hypothetical protein
MDTSKITKEYKPLIDRYLQEVVSESNEQLGDSLVDLLLKIERIRLHISEDSVELNAAQDIKTLDKLSTWQSDDPDLAIIQGGLNRLGKGQTEGGIDYLALAIKRRLEKISTEQSRKASFPRKESPLKEIVEELVIDYPELTADAIVTKLILLGSVDSGYSYEEWGEYFEPEDTSEKTIKKSTITRKWIPAIKKKLTS